MLPLGHVVRVLDGDDGSVRVGLVDPQGVAPLVGVRSIADLLHLGVGELRTALADTGPLLPRDRLRVLPPVDGATEVWAAGVTYLASRDAREEESDDREVYRRVYDAERPELFYKSPAWRVVTDGEPIGIRDDSDNDVPEPEVGLVLNRLGEVVGYTIVDDVSSRSIEGANPLYLPQAKLFAGCCAVGPSIAPRWLVEDDMALSIRMAILRDGAPMFEGSSSTARLKRSFDELAAFLFAEATFPDGAVLATGTAVVPPLSTTLLAGDVVEIEIDGLGSQRTPVAAARQVGAWLDARRDDPSTEAPVAPARVSP